MEKEGLLETLTDRERTATGSDVGSIPVSANSSYLRCTLSLSVVVAALAPDLQRARSCIEITASIPIRNCDDFPGVITLTEGIFARNPRLNEITIVDAAHRDAEVKVLRLHSYQFVRLLEMYITKRTRFHLGLSSNRDWWMSSLRETAPSVVYQT
jgi:hypothetical protein